MRSFTCLIKRSPEAKDEFKRENPCPSTGKKNGEDGAYTATFLTITLDVNALSGRAFQ